jgi:hypothetical protein
MTLLLWLVHRGGVLQPLAIVARDTALVGLAALVSFGIPGLAAVELGSGPWDLVAAIAGLGLFALAVRTALPGFAAVALRMLAPVLRVGARPGARTAGGPVAAPPGAPDVLP